MRFFLVMDADGEYQLAISEKVDKPVISAHLAAERKYLNAGNLAEFLRKYLNERFGDVEAMGFIIGTYMDYNSVQICFNGLRKDFLFEDVPIANLKKCEQWLRSILRRADSFVRDGLASIKWVEFHIDEDVF